MGKRDEIVPWFYDPHVHLKTGNKYYVLDYNVIDCTNSHNDARCVLYMNTEGKLFVREFEEFNEKFVRLA